ncbi:putative eukaryotic translation initiation factor 3 62 kDa subunit [Lyophyllum shimeji]|uniref:tRNA (adenine(58)-N(1))-methyltransferase non-catalytic subunit TRM6 n=1 Tax=Lyophyllum shimeji TaxID=47721 RepID=A0A9P3PI25_LYOSH|nr:putative eukaryotic translation initiation factor 3 62 kDa subunit [Lyophyllum shimeji]
MIFAMTSHDASSLQELDSRDVTIQSGDLVLLRLPNGDVKGVKVEKNSTVAVGRLGSFHANELIGQPYGLTYEMANKILKAVPPRTLQEVEDTEATNELINDGEFVQPLTIDEIEKLKASGVHVSDMIKMQIEQHANYSLKTEYSKEKYKKRKEEKYSKSFTTIEPTLFNVCEYWFNKDRARIRDIRVDSLAQMLNLANIRPGGRYLVVDDASGLVVAGILERMGGEGRLLTICDTDSPPAYPVVANMNFKPHVTSGVLVSLNWATSEEDYIPIIPPSDVPPDQIRSERQKSRLNKRKAVTDLLTRTRDELFSGEFDSLVVASEYDPWSILQKLIPYVAGSGSVVVHSPHLQILADLQTQMRTTSQFLSPTITEPWLRRYQILPGRTHPTMNTSGSGGFILHAIKIYDDPNASAITFPRRTKPKKAKTEHEGIELFLHDAWLGPWYIGVRRIQRRVALKSPMSPIVLQRHSCMVFVYIFERNLHYVHAMSAGLLSRESRMRAMSRSGVNTFGREVYNQLIVQCALAANLALQGQL